MKSTESQARKVKSFQPARPVTRHLENFSVWVLYGVLLTPLFTWGGFLAPQLTAKVLGFQVLVEAALLVALLSAALGGGAESRKSGAGWPFLLAAYAVFLAYLVFSAFLGVDLVRSLWGILERQDGLILHFHFFVWTALLIRIYGRESDSSYMPGRRRFLSYLFFSFWVSVATAFTVLMEVKLKFDGLTGTLANLMIRPERLSGVFGNPIFSGSYLLFHFFCGLYFIAQHKKISGDASPKTTTRFTDYAKKGSIVFGELVILLAIWSGQTRGVLLGLTAGILLLVILAAFWVSGKLWLKSSVVVALAFAIVVAAFVIHYRDSVWIRKVPTLQRITHMSISKDPSAVNRILAWRSGLRAAGDHILLGWGHDNAYYGLSKHYDPRQIVFSPNMDDISVLWFDKSHNFLVDLLVEAGILGVGLFLFVFAAIAKGLSKVKDRVLSACLAGALAGYVVSNLVAFDSFGSLFCFYLALACIGIFSDVKTFNWKLSGNKKTAASSKGGRQPLRLRNGTIAVGVIAVIVMAYFQVETGFANYEYALAHRAFDTDPATGVSIYLNAFNRFSPYAGKEKLACVGLVLESVINKRKSSRSFEAGPLVSQLANEAINSHPNDPYTYITLNEYYNEMAVRLSSDFAVQAEIYGRKAVALAPKHQQALHGLSRSLIIQNRTGPAMDIIREMLQEQDFPMGHWLLGLALLQQNRREDGKREIKKGVEMGFTLNYNMTIHLKPLLDEKEIAELYATKAEPWDPFKIR